MFDFRRTFRPRVQFLCESLDDGVIAPPVPAKSVLPDWFRKLPPVAKAHANVQSDGLTIKRCMPFLDALTTGWIIPLAATVRLEVKDGGSTVDAGWDIDREMVSNHATHQVEGHPQLPRPPCKFHNYWTIVTPPGWSCLFVPPLNRPNGLFEIVAGVVDTDTYRSRINFPFFVTAGDGQYTLERGTPIVQVIPFKRAMTHLDAEIRVERPDEAMTRERTRRQTKAQQGWYRTSARAAR
jgi:hypothetical protein